MLIRSGTFDLLRCAAFSLIVIGVFVLLRRLARARPLAKAALPLARTGEQPVRAFVLRVAPVAVALLGLASLAAANRLGHRALVVTDNGGAVRVQHFELVGSAQDLDRNDVWIVNRTTRALRCNHMPVGNVRLVDQGWVIQPGHSLAVMWMPTYLGPDQEPVDFEAGTLWLTWER